MLWILDSISGALGSDVMEDHASDSESNKNSNNTVTDFVEICVRPVALKDANEECDCEL